MQEYSNKFVLSSANLIDLLCYPRFSTSDYYSRLSELRSLNLKFVILEGNTLLKAIRILGKGSEGLVLKVQNMNSNTMALKIRRIDSCRTDMKNEFEFYQRINRNHLGPKVYSYTRNALLMEFIEGLSARNWFLKSKMNLYAIKRIANRVFRLKNICLKIKKKTYQKASHRNLPISSPGLNFAITLSINEPETRSPIS